LAVCDAGMPPIAAFTKHILNPSGRKGQPLDDLNVNIDGSIVLDRDVRFFGSIAGTLTVPSGRRFELHGSVGKDLIVEKGAAVTVAGIVHGTLVNKGGDVLLIGSARQLDDRDPEKPTKREAFF